MLITVYLHSDKESMYDIGLKHGLSAKALERFRYACYEVEIGLDVDTDTGSARIMTVDDMFVQDNKWLSSSSSSTNPT